MTRLHFGLIGLMKFFALGVVAIFIFSGTADAKPSDKCSAEGQKPCPVWYSGPVCDPGLGTFGGKCRKCGKHGQRQCPAIERGRQCQKGLKKIAGKCYRSCGKAGEIACPKIYLGYPCRGATEPDSKNICRACGGNGQKACRAMKPGEQCNAGLDKDSKGVCRPCGGNGEMACSIIKAGTICESGLGQFDGVCRPCGLKGQRACPAIENGRQCEAWTTQRDGICRPCGTENARACRVTDRGTPCQDGLKRKLNGICVVSVEEATRRAAMAKLESTGAAIFLSAFDFTQSVNNDDSLKNSLEAEDASEISGNEVQAACGVDEDNTSIRSQTWTMSVGASVKALVGVEGEAGVAIPCDRETDGNLFNFENDEKLFKWFASSAFSLQLGAGAEGAVSVGWWVNEMDEIRGKSHGWTIDLTDLIGPAEKLKDIKIEKGVSASITWWFERRDEDGDGKDDEVGPYQGFTITIAAGKTAGLGSGYRAATTTQVCTYDMDCALHTWEGQGETIVVTARNEDRILVNMNGDTRIKFVRDTWLDKRDYKRLDDDGDVVERICFRSNFTKLFYLDGDDDCDDGKALRINKTAATTSDSAREAQPVRPISIGLPSRPGPVFRQETMEGKWSRGKTDSAVYVFEVVKHASGRYILVKLSPSNQIVRFDVMPRAPMKWEHADYGVVQSVGKGRLVWNRKSEKGSDIIVLNKMK
ncbi:MAG: hypothetical protein AAGL99_06970 [Pseudomonadota bacterium]